MKTVVCASNNPHKVKELTEITEKMGVRVISRNEAGVPRDFDVEETGKTFEENSLIKAKAIMDMTGLPAIADDSGLSVDFLDGAPGVYSARFSGEGATDESNNEKLLALMKDVPEEKRGARFVSVVTITCPDGRVIAARGECPGRVLTAPRGNGGFGYDPLFLPDGLTETFAEISQETKNSISHRANALRRLEEMLQKDPL